MLPILAIPLQVQPKIEPPPWSAWRPLHKASIDQSIPSVAGLYRVRHVGFSGIDYIGQTGGSLRARLGMLRGVYGNVMPYNDPHTAGPALWALRDATGCDYEASVAVVEESVAIRLALEHLAIALYRQSHGVSPTFNFGRMPAGYKKSSGNNQRLVAAGKRFRGGPCFETLPSHAPGIPPAGPLHGLPGDENWCGHAWSRWEAVASVVRDGLEAEKGGSKAPSSI